MQPLSVLWTRGVPLFFGRSSTSPGCLKPLSLLSTLRIAAERLAQVCPKFRDRKKVPDGSHDPYVLLCFPIR